MRDHEHEAADLPRSERGAVVAHPRGLRPQAAPRGRGLAAAAPLEAHVVRKRAPNERRGGSGTQPLTKLPSFFKGNVEIFQY